ncbi:MAG TPA: hypothetical protein VMV49_08470 [Candidatus Deferrimicrobium sp.]|nr:hypothetical protein [Candidatus Deferrimicrobium sp.]
MADDQPPDVEQIKKEQEIIRKLQEKKKAEREKMFAETSKDAESKEKVKELFKKRLEGEK